MNLSNLPNLQLFSLCAIVNCKAPWNAPWNAPPFAVLHDINIVLGTIPKFNTVTNFFFGFEIVGGRPFEGCLDQDWVGLFNEVIRIADGNPLELDLQLMVTRGDEHPSQDELYMYITEKAALLSTHLNICTHWWNPTLSTVPFPHGQVRTRCRR